MSARRAHPRGRVARALPLDHLVVAVPALSAAVEAFASQLGATPRPGGRHAGLGTWNALLPLDAGAYVELIAADPEAPAPRGPRPFGLDERSGPRLAGFALRSRDLEADTARAREDGFDPGRLLPVSRTGPDGEALAWRLTMRPEALRGEWGPWIPFLIDWGEAPHPADAWESGCRLRHFSLRHPDRDAAARMLEALGSDISVEEASAPGLRAELEGPAGRLALDSDGIDALPA